MENIKPYLIKLKILLHQINNLSEKGDNFGIKSRAELGVLFINMLYENAGISGLEEFKEMDNIK